ncbi:hypothetical protein QQF64_031558 [Cirrhinus molitorella]|uniref:Secreted protein n=1 Tax=Cirrhinus molitorella TaxID=172907 RepID=A0ABR3MXA6_9TELE
MSRPVSLVLREVLYVYGCISERFSLDCLHVTNSDCLLDLRRFSGFPDPCFVNWITPASRRPRTNARTQFHGLDCLYYCCLPLFYIACPTPLVFNKRFAYGSKRYRLRFVTENLAVTGSSNC